MVGSTDSCPPATAAGGTSMQNWKVSDPPGAVPRRNPNRARGLLVVPPAPPAPSGTVRFP